MATKPKRCCDPSGRNHSCDAPRNAGLPAVRMPPDVQVRHAASGQTPRRLSAALPLNTSLTLSCARWSCFFGVGFCVSGPSASFGTIPHIVPNLCPLLSPCERSFTGGAGLYRKIGLFHLHPTHFKKQEWPEAQVAMPLPAIPSARLPSFGVNWSSNFRRRFT